MGDNLRECIIELPEKQSPRPPAYVLVSVGEGGCRPCPFVGKRSPTTPELLSIFDVRCALAAPHVPAGHRRALSALAADRQRLPVVLPYRVMPSFPRLDPFRGSWDPNKEVGTQSKK